MHRPRHLRYTWKSFSSRDGRNIETQLRHHDSPSCPCCGERLEARATTRLVDDLPLDAKGYDLDCRGCRRFWCIVRHTVRSLRLLRMRRLVAAVRAVEPERSAEKDHSIGAAA